MHQKAREECHAQGFQDVSNIRYHIQSKLIFIILRFVLLAMIDEYDDMQEKVKLYEAQLKGRNKSSGNLTNISMKMIIDKNKKIVSEKKQHLDRVIKARKLKIKISQVLNIKNLQNQLFLKKQKSILGIRMETKLQNRTRVNNFQASIMKTQGDRRKSSSFRSLTRKTRIATYSNSRQKGLDEGFINLFDHFTDDQLDQIQQDESYYLMKAQFITVFRKYMHRKRMNNKDYSYQNSTLKPNKSQINRIHKEQNDFDKKSYILKTLGIQQSRNHNELHLLTNPIQFSPNLSAYKSKSLSYLKQRKSSLFLTFKQKQQSNRERLLQQHNKKILDLKIDRNYFDGLAGQKRAIYQEQFKKSILKRNREDKQRSIKCRERIYTVKEQYGKSIELAENIRMEILKRRMKNKIRN